MLLSESHPKFYLVFLVVREAISRRASRIIMTRGHTTFNVSFEIDGEFIGRDDIDNRHWNQTLGALYVLMGETDLHPETSTDKSVSDSMDSILISDCCPSICNIQLEHLRGEVPLPIVLTLTFETNSVSIAFSDTYNHEPESSEVDRGHDPS